MSLPIPQENWVCLVAEAVATTKAGIFVEQDAEQPQIFTVQAAGPKAEGYAAGDRVVLPKHCGHVAKILGTTYVFVRHTEVMAKL